MSSEAYSKKMKLLKTAICLFWLSSASVAQALIFSARLPEQGLIAEQAEFWTRIFSHYASTVTLVHDTRQVQRVVDVIDFRRAPYRTVPSWSQRQKIASRYVKRYRKALRRFKKYRLTARKFGAIEQRLYNVYRHDLGRLLRGKVHLRSQSGLRDTYITAIRRAQPYMAHMEDIFAQHRVPKELVRMTFVESMFNHNARSKVGAAGVWQFMPRTAREFLHLNRLVDERISPLKATRAAAKLLRRNYRYLGTWPLAVTAYNQGAGSIKRAVRKLKTTDLNVIIARYRSNTFGFAGRNFYSEFLAANKVYHKLVDGKRHQPVPLVSVRLPKKVSTASLIKKTSLDQNTLGKYNPCFSPGAFTSRRYMKLPPYYEIYVPRQMAAKIKREVRRI